MTDEERLDDLEVKQLAKLDDMASIKEQLARANLERTELGKLADPDWYFAANRALRHSQIDYQDLLMQAGRLRRAIKAEERKRSQRLLERAFVDVAEEELEKDTFIRLLKMAKARTE